MAGINKDMVAKGVLITVQTVLLWLIYWCGNQLVLWLKLPIPGNVVGMILLFVLLLMGVVKLKHVEQAAQFLLDNMVFFFIPMAVGLMKWGWLFLKNGVVLTAAIVIGAVLPFLVTGGIIQKMHGGKNKCREE